MADPRNDTIDKDTIKYLLRIYFDDTDEKNPFDDEKELSVSHNIINSLAEIILYTANPILFNTLENSTHLASRELITNTQLHFKLPSSIMTMIAYRHSRTNIMNVEIIQCARQIFFVAKQNEDYWHARVEERLQWRLFTIEQYELYNHRNNNNYNNSPFGKEGWIPVTIKGQHNLIDRRYIDHENSDNASLKISYFEEDYDEDGESLIILVNKHIEQKDFADYDNRRVGIDLGRNNMIKVELKTQRTWIYYDSRKIHLLPPNTNPESYVLATFSANFPSIYGSTFFVERSDCVFKTFPQNDSMFIDYDALSSTPDTSISVTGFSSDIGPNQFMRITNDYMNTFENNVSYLGRGLTLTLSSARHPNRARDYSFGNIVERLGESPYFNNITTLQEIFNQICDRSPPRIPNNIDQDYYFYTYFYNGHEADQYDARYGNAFNLIRLLDIYTFRTNDDPLSRINAFFLDLPYRESQMPPMVEFRYEHGVVEEPPFISEEDEEEEVIVAPPVPRPGIRRVPRVPRVPSYFERQDEPKLFEMPKHINKLIVMDAMSKEDSCSITFEPLTLTNTSIVSCFHMFDYEAIKKWYETESDHPCPLCRKPIEWIVSPVGENA